MSASRKMSPSSIHARVVNKVTPLYPPLVRTMNLSGTVKLEVLVQASGTVKSIEVRGGSPLLTQSAQTAVHAWKWEKAEHESTELIEFHFHP
ncbi:MAG: hypothetical protein DMG93_10345 [Acidobacteria bacterium]|nr:MAG: hypothetical protein DMG93_10345 [Acidobacteriota bacterium]